MRRFHTGLELDDLTVFSSTVQTGTMTIAAAAAAARTGSGPRGLRASWDGVTRGRAYAQVDFSTAIWYNAHDASSSLNSLLRSTAPSSCDIRGYYRTDMPNTSANAAMILALADSGGTNRVTLSCIRSGTNRILRLAAGGANADTVFSLAASTVYRFHLHLEVLGTTGLGRASLLIYDENSILRRDAISTDLNIGLNDLYRFLIGYIATGNAFTQNGAQNHDFDDIAINDHVVVGADVHNTRDRDMKAGSTLARHAPTSDVAVAWNRFLGATNFGEVDEAVPNDNTDYVYTTTAAGTPTDRYGHTAYGGADTIRSVAVQFKHMQETQDLSINDLGHTFGGYDGASYLTVAMPARGAVWTYTHVILSEQVGGGALTNAWYAALEITVRKTIDLGFNDKRVTTIRIEAEDDDGRSLPHHRPGRPGRAMIGR